MSVSDLDSRPKAPLSVRARVWRRKVWSVALFFAHVVERRFRWLVGFGLYLLVVQGYPMAWCMIPVVVAVGVYGLVWTSKRQLALEERGREHDPVKRLL